MNIALGEVGVGIANVIQDIQQENEKAPVTSKRWACVLGEVQVTGTLNLDKCLGWSGNSSE
ncbi:hypothetical protein [Enterovibrio coralii]|nr:hypothetical protein [Enterovibrio coralii]